jgi:CubicO group peptidase (beta-lactamase class C family)
MRRVGRGAEALGLLAGALLALGASPPLTSPSPFPSTAEVRRILAERVDAISGPRPKVGIVVGLVSPAGRTVVGYGPPGADGSLTVDGDTVFEIGSVGKVLTALLLSDMALRGEVALQDPVARYLKSGVTISERPGHPIRLVDLATHTSGLPFMPDAIPAWNAPGTPPYGAAEIYNFLGSYSLKRDPGTDWDYSNLGYWLLGEALASRAGIDFETLLERRILVPLNLESTSFTVPERLKTRLALGHDASLAPAPAFGMLTVYNAMPAAGGLLSTANDLVRLVAAALGVDPSPLGPSLDAMLETRRPGAGGEQAMGWVVTGKGEEALVTHDGFTWGYTAAVAWDPSRKVGVVVISNQASGVSDIARHLLRPSSPLETPPVWRHNETALAPGALEAFPGTYDLVDEGVARIVRESQMLVLELPRSWGLPRFRLHPAGPKDFFVRELPIRVVFETDESGRVVRIMLTPPRGQHVIPADRIAPKG